MTMMMVMMVMMTVMPSYLCEQRAALDDIRVHLVRLLLQVLIADKHAFLVPA